MRDPASMKRFPNSLRQFLQAENILEGFRADAREQIRSRLSEIRQQEEKLLGDISGIDIENQLNRIVKIIAPKASSPYRGTASLFERKFNPKQRSILYGLLNRLEERRKWAGVRYGKHAANSMLNEFIQKARRTKATQSIDNQ